jgi:hypothetical protein
LALCLLTTSLFASDVRAFDVKKITTNLALATMTDAELASVSLERRVLGALELPDGGVVTADPVVFPERPPLVQTLPPGAYVVETIVVPREGRNAALLLRAGLQAPSRWELGVEPGQDVSTLKDDEYFGFSVDAGLAMFGSSRYAEALARREADERARGVKNFNAYDGALAEALGPHEPTSTLFYPLASRRDAGAAVAASGWGDGFYPVFVGRAADGSIAAMMIDFQVIEDANGVSRRDRLREDLRKAMTPEQIAFADDVERMIRNGRDEDVAALIRSGRVAPTMFLPSSGSTPVFEAIIHDRPVVLAALIDAGAKDAMPLFVFGNATTWPTYSAYVDWRSKQSEGQIPQEQSPSPAMSAQIERLRRSGPSPASP